eukprot:TRINITY_DN29266_c0_g1_i1.p1 TRINITY_DN29266_c0_g1~~TRINITY_DN29266_c0_g1_i1.p1  ORF type:complete len:249 (+),score=11.62 TRINITY_DN29266_c0_g1_i1:12-758(+)
MDSLSIFASLFSFRAESRLPASLRTWHLTLEEVPSDDACECPICLAQIVGQHVKTRCGHAFHFECLERNFEVTGQAFCPLCRRALNGSLVVTARALSGRPIQVLDDLPSSGGKCHIDRDYRFLTLGFFARRPRMLYVLTSNDDKRTSARRGMWVLETVLPTTVYLNFRSERHLSCADESGWLQAQGWERLHVSSTISTGFPGWLYWGPVFSKCFEPGTINLMGSNCPEGAYFVFVEIREADGVDIVGI